MKMFALLLGTVASAALSQATPATQVAAPMPVATIAPAIGGDTLRAGAEVQLTMAENLALLWQKVIFGIPKRGFS